MPTRARTLLAELPEQRGARSAERPDPLWERYEDSVRAAEAAVDRAVAAYIAWSEPALEEREDLLGAECGAWSAIADDPEYVRLLGEGAEVRQARSALRQWHARHAPVEEREGMSR